MTIHQIRQLLYRLERLGVEGDIRTMTLTGDMPSVQVTLDDFRKVCGEPTRYHESRDRDFVFHHYEQTHAGIKFRATKIVDQNVKVQA